jgi:NADH:ubiquinone oxidoreductase subunit 2 (subunit N)
MVNMPNLNLWAVLPALSLSIGACLLFLIDAFVPRQRKDITAWLSLIGVGVSLVLSFAQLSVRTTTFNGSSPTPLHRWSISSR